MRKFLFLLIILNLSIGKEILPYHDEVYKKLSLDYEKEKYVAEMLDDGLPAPKFQSEIVDLAIGLLGTKYIFGGETINGMDCSSFVQKVYKMAGIQLPRTARYQAQFGIYVDRKDLKPGDLLFFQTYAKFPSHVGIYIGDNKMIHASSSAKRIVISDITKEYYIKHFLFAKRIFLYNPNIVLNSEENIKNGKN